MDGQRVQLKLQAQLNQTLAELDGLRTAMRSRAIIEQAKGMLMLRLGVDEDAAFDYLRRLSNTQNVRLVELARRIVLSRAGQEVA